MDVLEIRRLKLPTDEKTFFIVLLFREKRLVGKLKTINYGQSNYFLFVFVVLQMTETRSTEVCYDIKLP